MDRIRTEILSKGMVPVFNHADKEVAFRVVKACYDAGLRVFEWTNRGAGAASMFRVIKEFIDRNCPGMILGAGSVFDGETCRKFHSMGASFIVSPVIDPEMATVCKELKLLWIPGCGTVTEIHQARKWGAGIVKIFPGDAVGGPGFVKAVLGPMPWAEIMPTGGVNPDPENLKAWFKVGVCCVGMGSQLFTKERVNDENAENLVTEISKTLNSIKECRKM
ncbi:MAG: bifunctional 4-hydroxy-2-oxoglutarate aldolase/2-dehydro-3-deoxy-phosphogluconate aldolase [Bacteroidales bacterium]|jgi:2-dehydro-3-deoxyphosphogluconate aldolase/(4S)-4-hydroxy-2-oxoglutarate aldolase